MIIIGLAAEFDSLDLLFAFGGAFFLGLFRESEMLFQYEYCLPESGSSLREIYSSQKICQYTRVKDISRMNK